MLTKTIDYSFGHDELSQTTREYNSLGQITSELTHLFGHDGHASVRMLTDLTATVAQFYQYDAYGQLLGIWNGAGALLSGGADGELASASLALTSTLYSGEQFDASIGQQYLRARYYDPATGRFNRLDPFFGNQTDPQSFHKYLYTHADPVNGIDPTGMMALGSTLGGLSIGTSLTTISIGAVVGGAISESFYFISTPASEWSTTGALSALGTCALMGAAGSTIIGAAWFAAQGVYEGSQVWRNPESSALQKWLASVNILLSVASAYILKGQVRSQYLEWKNVYSRIPLGVEVQRDLRSIRSAYEAGEESIKVGRIQIAFIDRPGRAGGTFAGMDDFFYLTPEALARNDDFLMHTIIEENVHLYRAKTGEGLGALAERGMNHELRIAPEEQLVGSLTDDIFNIGRERYWW